MCAVRNGELCKALRYKAEGRGSIPDDVTGIFHWHNPSDRTMTLGSTQLLTGVSTRNTSWGGKGGRCVGLATVPPKCAYCLEIWEPQPPGTLRNGVSSSLFAAWLSFRRFSGNSEFLCTLPVQNSIRNGQNISKNRSQLYMYHEDGTGLTFPKVTFVCRIS